MIIIKPLTNWMFENDGLPVMGTMHVITLPRAQRASYSVHQMRRASTAKPDGKNGHQTLPLRIKLMSYLAGIEPCCHLQTQYIWI